LILLLLLVLGGILFWAVGGYSWPDSIYLTLLDAAGDASAQTTLSATDKATQVMVTLVGIAWIPVITAAVVDAVVAARLRRMVTGHIIIAGLGDVGSRVLAILHEQGIPVLGIDRDENVPGAVLARRLGVPTVAGDLYREVTWNAASVSKARAVLLLTSDDVLNTEGALRARALRGDMPLVLRIFDDDLAEQAQRNFGATACLSVARMAGPAFAAALAGHQVLDTIQVGRSPLLIADTTITADSPLAGRPLQQAHDPRQSRILAVTAKNGSGLDWMPTADRMLQLGDRLLALSTSAGLASQRRADRRSKPKHS
jgi:Trk K+ transport system NAD-binding subunit